MAQREAQKKEPKPEMVYFPVNVSGIPMNQESYKRMWDFYYEKYHYSATKKNKLKREIEEKSRNVEKKRRIPVPPTYRTRKSTPSYIKRCQRYISSLKYNMIGFQLYYIDKGAPLLALHKTAKEMIKCALPIKCLEAVILSIYLTNEVVGLDRFTITFKSVQNGLTYYHTVLGLYYRGKYGAMGLSRKVDLMDRDFEFDDLSAMILSYDQAYRNHGHKLLKATIGQMVPRDPAENDRIVWSDLQMEMNKPCESGWPHCKCSQNQKRNEPITCRLSSLNLKAISPDLS